MTYATIYRELQALRALTFEIPDPSTANTADLRTLREWWLELSQAADAWYTPARHAQDWDDYVEHGQTYRPVDYLNDLLLQINDVIVPF